MTGNIGLLVLVAILAVISFVVNYKYAMSAPSGESDVQTYVLKHMDTYGVRDTGTSLDEREIHVYGYDAMGFDDNV